MRIIIDDVDHIKHFGVKGQKWGVRRKPTYAQRIETRKAVGEVMKSTSPFHNPLYGGIFAGLGAQRIAKAAGQDATIALGIGTAAGLAVRTLMNRHKNKKMSEINP